MGFWKQLTEQFKKMWTKFATWQKATVIGATSLALIGIIIFIVVANKPSMEPLYTNLDPKDASAIAAKLKENKVDYQLGDEGRTIFVPADQKYQLRLDMAEEVNLSGVVGFESFNETRFGETDTDKRVRFLVSLQGELTRTIDQLDEVAESRVHIALPAPSLFIQEQEDSTASVLLRLKPYAKLKPNQVKSIMAFISHSVEGLEEENVTVMDVNGNLLSDGLAEDEGIDFARISTTQLALKQEYEEDLARSVQSMLEKMRGPGKAVVRANVDMDFDKYESHKETYGDAVLADEHIKEERAKGMGTQNGGNPADTNMGGPSYGTAGNTGESEYELTDRTRNYDVSKTVESEIRAPGKIEKISLSVLVDGELTPQEQEKITEAVSSAAGIDLTRGDQVSVVGMAFNTEYYDEMKQAMEDSQQAQARQRYIQMGITGLGLLLLIAAVVYLLRKKRKEETDTGAFVGYTETAASQPEFEFNTSMSPEFAEKKAMRDQVEKLTQSNPEEAAKVVKTWLIEE